MADKPKTESPKTYRARRDFTDRNGKQWIKGAPVQLADDEIAELVDNGAVEEAPKA